MQKQKYVFVRKIMRERKYKDYFDPDPEVEKRLLGLEDLVCYASMLVRNALLMDTDDLRTEQKPEKRSRKSAVHDEDCDMYADMATYYIMANPFRSTQG